MPNHKEAIKAIHRDGSDIRPRKEILVIGSGEGNIEGFSGKKALLPKLPFSPFLKPKNQHYS